jgi:predicted O-methyltransferase YrrM
MIFIDADHSYKSSYYDFLNYKDLVRNDGIILLHDTCPGNEDMTKPSSCHDTWKTAVMIKENHKDECEIVTIPDGCGVSIVRMNRGKHLIWSK